MMKLKRNQPSKLGIQKMFIEITLHCPFVSAGFTIEWVLCLKLSLVNDFLGAACKTKCFN